MKVGIPRTLFYYAYSPFILSFLEELGVEVVVSEQTSKEIIDEGVEDAVSDACVPIKLFHGHVKNLFKKADLILVPRLVSVNKEATFCPKFLGLPDMLENSIPDFNNMLEIRVDTKGKKRELFKICLKTAKILGKGFLKAWKACNIALKSYEEYCQRMQEGALLPLGIESQDKNKDIKLGVVGYPYILYDSYLSLDIIKKLISLGCYVITPEMLPERVKKEESLNIKKLLFWTFSNNVLRASYHFINNRNVDGIIHVTAFGCGPDFIVDKLLELECKEKNIPFLTVTLDEHTGQEGVNTRLEAFVDMIKIKKARKEAAVS
ncbi:MAG: acyl-CoA dehydratase activase-related protein [Thermovenabulum sp.]|uniref:acyl-CoA dehydratase activase-related protein n=1 Tax=Thermovenabulum sp. TaxID=3100335 RepID=UPI003C7AD59E